MYKKLPLHGLLLLTAHCLPMAAPCQAQQIPVATIPRPLPPVSAPLSGALKKWDRERQAEAASCDSDYAQARAQTGTAVGDEHGGFEIRYAVLLDTARLFSVGMQQNIYCGGAYPASAETAVLFDKLSGRQLDPLTLYRIAEKTGSGYTFLPAIQSIVREKLLALRTSDGSDDDCIEVLKTDQMEVFGADIIALTQTGLRIMYSGPHVVQACYEPVELPYAGLAKYLQRGRARELDWRR